MSFYPGCFGREVGLVSVLDEWACMYVTYGWIRVLPPTGPGALPSTRRHDLFLSFHDRVSVRDIQDPIRRCDTKNQLIEGPGRQIRTGDAHIEDPGDRQLSFPEKIAQHKDAHQLKIELFESLKDVVGGGRGN
jgi:hypothetical protein